MRSCGDNFFGERVLQSAIVSLILAPKFRQVPARRAAQARQFAQQRILSRNPEKAVELVIDSNVTACVMPAPLNVQSVAGVSSKSCVVGSGEAAKTAKI